MRDTLREGFGTYKYVNNQSYYRGRWQDNQKHGKATINYYNGDIFEGTMINDQREGQNCSYQWRDQGNMMKADFVNDMPIAGEIFIDGRPHKFDLRGNHR